MLSNDYKHMMQPLRSREVEPSFEEIRSLVLEERKSRRFLAIPFWLYLSGSAPMLLVLSIFLFPEIFGLERSTPHTTASESQAVFSVQENPQIATVEKNLSSFSSRPLSIPMVNKRQNPDEVRSPKNNDKGLALANNVSAPVSMNNVSEQATTEAISLPSATHSFISPVHNELQKPKGDGRMTDREKADHGLSFFISAGLPPVQSSFAFADRLYGSTGIRYRLNTASSVLLELRKNAFVRKYDAKKTIFHDTVLTAGNQTYHSTIGEITSYRTESPNDVFSAGLGYRYTFVESGILQPFVEVILSAATPGGLASELTGIRYSFSLPFSFELTLRSDQLFSHGLAAQSEFNLNAALNFSW